MNEVSVRCVTFRKRLPRISWWWRGKPVFISYRRAGSAYAAGRLHDRLEAKLGLGYVIRDVESIPPGYSFLDFIKGVMPGCGAVIAVIDPGWTISSASAECRYAHVPGDMVAYELGLAVEHGIKVIPVLTDGASMPRRDDLPEVLRPLSLVQAVELRADQNFHGDVERIIEALRA